MLKGFFYGLLLVFVLTGCFKEPQCEYDGCSLVAPANEIQDVQDYLATHSITNATQHCSGVFYVIDKPGSSTTPGACSYVDVTYSAYLADGTLVDQGRAPLELGTVIRGWRNTIPEIGEGGRIRIFVPPTLGYGSQAVGPIPPNSITVFTVDLNAVL